MFDALILHGRRSLTSVSLSLSPSVTLLLKDLQETRARQDAPARHAASSARRADAAGSLLLFLATRREQRERRALSPGCLSGFATNPSLTRAENFPRNAGDSQWGTCHICTHRSGGRKFNNATNTYGISIKTRLHLKKDALRRNCCANLFSDS